MGLLCDLGVVVITLLKLYSDTSLLRSAKIGGEAVIRREIMFTFMSCVLSIASFAVAMVGVRTVLLQLRAAAHFPWTALTSTFRRRSTVVVCCSSLQLVVRDVTGVVPRGVLAISRLTCLSHHEKVGPRPRPGLIPACFVARVGAELHHYHTTHIHVGRYMCFSSKHS